MADENLMVMPSCEFKESFADFKEKVLNYASGDEFDGDDLSENDIKSKAFLKSLHDTAKDRLSISDFIAVIPSITGMSDSTSYERDFWSAAAGNLQDYEAEVLIDRLDDFFRKNEGDPVQRKNLIFTFALKNKVAWARYGKELQEGYVWDEELLYALSKVYNVNEKCLPLLHKVLGKKFTEAYLENKELIDRTPRKKHFTVLTDEYLKNNFLYNFIQQVGKITSSFGVNSNSSDVGISEAIEKEGFKEAVRELMQDMLAHQNKYIYEAYPCYIDHVKVYFPELVTLMEENFSPEISVEKIEEISRRCFKEKQVGRMLNNDAEFTKKHADLWRNVVAALPDDMEQVRKAIEIKKKYYVDIFDAIKFVQMDMPEWMMIPVERAIQHGVISIDRLGSVETLFDAAKTWKICPNIPKKEAIMIGKMPLEARMVAGAIYDKISKDYNLNRSAKKECFWQEMKKAQDMGWKEAILHYCKDNAETRGRIISLYHPEIDDELQMNLRSCVNFKHLIDFDVEKYNHNAELFYEYLGMSKDELFYSDSDMVTEKNILLKRLAIFDKLFPDEEFKLKFLGSIEKSSIDGIIEAFRWLPPYFSNEKMASFATFLQKNLFYDDGSGKEVMRSVSSLRKIVEMWESLTSQQEQFNFDKLLGIYYTRKMVQDIDNCFNGDKWRFEEKSLNIPDDLRLYQKFLLIQFHPEKQKEVDALLSLNRSEGLEKLAAVRQPDRRFTESYYHYLTNLIIGNDAQIGEHERDIIAKLKPENILTFRSKEYKEIVNKIIKQVANDPKADELFRKYYSEIIAEDARMTNRRILDIRKHYEANRNWIAPFALRVLMTFGKDSMKYFNRIAIHNLSIQKLLNDKDPRVSQADIINVHDTCYWLPNNLTGNDRQSFKEFIDQNLFYKDETGVERYRSLTEFERIAKSWLSLSLTEEERRQGYKEVLKIISVKEYENVSYPIFAQEAYENKVTEEDYKNYERIYEQGLQVPELIDSSERFYLEKEVDGKKVVELVGRFLPRDDPRVGFFGQYTNCCQHFWGAGNACAISSIRDPFSQLFVVEKSDGTIVAGSWVWESKIQKDGQYYKAFCFDNIEAIGDYKEDTRVSEVYKMVLPYLASLNYAKITVGMGYQDGLVDEFPDDVHPIPLNKNYSGYTDAYNQKIMMENPEATPVPYNEGDIYVTGALEDDIPDMQRVSERCFPVGDQELQLPDEDPQGLVLRDKGKIVGYVVYSEKERHVYDMAVLPEYRSSKMKMPDGTVKKIEYKGGSRASSLMLLESMAEKIKKIGGDKKWGAELRDSTSLKYMKFMAAKGLLDLEIGDVEHEMSDKTKVYSVTFSVKDKKDEPQQERIQSVNNIHDGR